GDAESDPRFRARPDQTKSIKSFLAVPILEQGVCIGVVSVASERPEEFSADDEDLLALATAVCGPHVRTVRVSRLAHPDPLTGVIDPRRLDEAYPDLDGLVVADPLSILVLEVDGLDKQRDRFGRGFAEDLLKSVAELLANDVRRNDPVIRHGAHGFLVLLPGVALPTASHIAERIRRAIEGDMILSRPDVAKLTVSIGIAERTRDERRDAFLARAGAALEAARRRGGNRVEYA
ncbi:MAG: diguanylate cyclase, partial [Deltaproteobacteria bacterium]|nr:diguanylate cyclase [Deltaproteobacteria bacterium]